MFRVLSLPRRPSAVRWRVPAPFLPFAGSSMAEYVMSEKPTMQCLVFLSGGFRLWRFPVLSLCLGSPVRDHGFVRHPRAFLSSARPDRGASCLHRTAGESPPPFLLHLPFFPPQSFLPVLAPISLLLLASPHFPTCSLSIPQAVLSNYLNLNTQDPASELLAASLRPARFLIFVAHRFPIDSLSFPSSFLPTSIPLAPLLDRQRPRLV